jgi:hypothetical protein
MKTILALLGLLCTIGCQVPREMKLCRVIDDSSCQPISGAKVHVQPYAPIHPFWPAGASGVTDANGEVSLSLPSDYWWYFGDVHADGYSQVTGQARPLEPGGRKFAFLLFSMQRKEAKS